MPINKVDLMKPTYLASLIGLAFISCSQSEPLQPTKPLNKPKEYTHVIKMATESFSAVHNYSRFSSSIESVQPWLTCEILNDDYSVSRSYDNLPDTLLYVVNFSNDNGAVLISDNEIFRGVLAVMDNNFDPHQEIESPEFNFFLKSYCESLKTNRIHSTTNFSEVKQYLPTNIATSEATENWETIFVYPNKLYCKWGQDAPYNKYCLTPDGKQAVAGCLPVAVAQALTYFKYPSKINDYTIHWEHLGFEFPSTYNHAESSARLISEIGKYVQARYGEHSTGTDANKILTFFSNHGFYITKSNGFHDLMAIQNISDYGPFLVAGRCVEGGHGWVIDGAHVQRKQIDDKQTLRFLFHCNWGWNGKYNGYFLSTAFDPYRDGINPGSDRHFKDLIMYHFIVKQ
jgi:hypothetical protein